MGGTTKTKKGQRGRKRKGEVLSDSHIQENKLLDEQNETKQKKTCDLKGKETVESDYFKTKPSNATPLKVMSENISHTNSKTTPSKSDIFSQILTYKRTLHFPPLEINVTKQVGDRSSNLIHHLYGLESGMKHRDKVVKSSKDAVVDLISNLQLYRTASPFDRRCTALEWHPTNPNKIAVGSKGGELILWSIDGIDDDHFIPGMGPGGSIQALKFMPRNDKHVLTASIDGTVTIRDFEGKQNKIVLDTMNSHDYWYCSFDLHEDRNVIVAGENSGKMTMCSPNGNVMWTHKLHKDKVTHLEFNKRQEWLLCSASVDKTCKLWDIRMIKDKNSALVSLQHERGVDSAYFSLSSGNRLLTTDQHSEIRLYSGPIWENPKVIKHPHRAFQHITHFKAFWHPLQDLIVIGRYPDPNFPGYTKEEKRTIDVFDGDTAEMVTQLSDANSPGLISLNKFSPLGDTLASTMGLNILIWKRREEVEEKQLKLIEQMKQKGIDPNANQKKKPRKPRDKQTKDTKAKQTEANAKLKLKMARK